MSSSDRSTVNIQSMAGRHSPAPPPAQGTQPLDSRQPAAKLGFPFHSIKDNYSIHAPHTPCFRHMASSVRRNPRQKGEEGVLVPPQQSEIVISTVFWLLQPAGLPSPYCQAQNFEAFLKILRAFNYWHRLGATFLFFLNT